MPHNTHPTTIKKGIEALAKANPEQWWNIKDVFHPVGNLNYCLLQAISSLALAIPGALKCRSLEVVDIGELELTSNDVELLELYNSFVILFGKLSKEAGEEWQAWDNIINDKKGSGVGGALPSNALEEYINNSATNIGIIGRAEKRLVVCCSRILLRVNDFEREVAKFINEEGYKALVQVCGDL